MCIAPVDNVLRQTVTPTARDRAIEVIGVCVCVCARARTMIAYTQELSDLGRVDRMSGSL